MAETNSKLPLREILGTLVSAGVATGLLLLVGMSYWNAYYRRMGVPAYEIVLEPAAYLVTGFFSLLPVAVAVVLVALLLAVVVKRDLKIELDAATHGQNLLAYVAGASLIALMAAILEVNDEPIMLFGRNLRVSASQVVLVVMLIALTMLILVSTTKVPALVGLLFGRTFTGQIILLVVAASAVTATANIEGSREASDRLWHLAPYQEATLVLSNGSTPAPYFFVAHSDGFYYLRNLTDVGGKTPEITILRDDAVSEAVLRVVD